MGEKGKDKGDLRSQDVRAEGASVTVTGASDHRKKNCRHDSARVDGLLDSCCLKCGADGYWHDGHRHDELHPSGKVLFRLHPSMDGSSSYAEAERAEPASNPGGMSWTILLCKDCGQRAHYQDRCPKDRRRIWTEMVEVPVVPCDEAAIERAKRVVIDNYYYDDDDPDWARELAEAVLRAAGEAA